MSQLHHDFDRIIKQDFVSYDEPCLNSPPGRTHNVIRKSSKHKNPLVKLVWIGVRSFDQKTGAIGSDCIKAVAAKLNVDLASYSTLGREDDPLAADGESEHHRALVSASPDLRAVQAVKPDFNAAAHSRPSVAQRYAINYIGMYDEFDRLGLTQFRRSRDKFIGIPMSQWKNDPSEFNAQALRGAAEARAFDRLENLRTFNKLYKIVTIMQDHCAKHMEGKALSKQDIVALENKYRRYIPLEDAEWIALAHDRLPRWIATLERTPYPENMKFSSRQMKFCGHLSDNLGHPGDFRPEEFAAFTKLDGQPQAKLSTGKPSAQKKFDF